MRKLAFLLTVVSLPFSLSAQTAPSPAVGPQYDTTHVYVAPGEIDAFVSSFIATFGGTASKPSTTTVTPTPSRTLLRVLVTPVGLLSVFAFQTSIPFPFGEERTGYLVTNMDPAIQAARSAGAEVIVAPFKDPIGIDTIIQWPGGVKMQLYWHFKPRPTRRSKPFPTTASISRSTAPMTSCATSSPSPAARSFPMTATPMPVKSAAPA